MSSSARWPTAGGGAVRAGTTGLLAAFLGVVTPAPAGAQTLLCSAATAGQLSWQADVRCACRFFTASDLAGTPAGFRWDCGILRARVSPWLQVDLNPYPYPLPDYLTIERALPLEPR